MAGAQTSSYSKYLLDQSCQKEYLIIYPITIIADNRASSNLQSVVDSARCEEVTVVESSSVVSAVFAVYRVAGAMMG